MTGLLVIWFSCERRAVSMACPTMRLGVANVACHHAHVHWKAGNASAFSRAPGRSPLRRKCMQVTKWPVHLAQAPVVVLLPGHRLMASSAGQHLAQHQFADAAAGSLCDAVECSVLSIHVGDSQRTYTMFADTHSRDTGSVHFSQKLLLQHMNGTPWHQTL